MSFLHSKRLHWGAHHEVMENLRLHIERFLPGSARTGGPRAATSIKIDAPLPAEAQSTPLERSRLFDELFGP